jgi:hypothetical protein
VLAAQADGLVAGPLGGAAPRAWATAVGRDQGGLALLAAAGQQMANGANGQAQGSGDRRRALAALVPAGDGLTNGEGDRCRHGRSSRRGEPESASLSPAARQNYVSALTAKLHVG